MASQPFLQCLQHTQFENWSLREYNFGESTISTTVYDVHIFENRVSRRISWRDWTSHPIQPAVTTYIYSTNSTTVYHIHIFEKRVSQRISWLVWTSHPIQPAVMTYIFSNIEFCQVLFGENQRFNQFNQQLRHTYIYT